MPASTYTPNIGIEKVGIGEQDGSWGNTLRDNWDLMDQAFNGQVTATLATAASSGTPNTLPITDGTLSNGRAPQITFSDGGDLGATAYVQLTPNSAKKVGRFRNSLSGSRDVVIFQGTYDAGNAYTIPNGKDVTLRFDGAGAGAVVADAYQDWRVNKVDAITLSINGTAITSTAAELNILDGVTATATELNKLDGVTASTAELNLLDGVTSTTAELNILDGVTSTTAELNILDGVTATATELNKLDGVTASTAELNILDGVTATTAELNKVDGFTGTVADLNYAASLNATGVTAAEFNKLDGFTGSVADLNYAAALNATGVTSTEYNYLDGVTSNIQTQLNSATTGNETITLSGDATGSGTTAITVVVVNDSHSHTGATISGLATGDITSGTFVDARIPSLATSKITSGTFADARISQSSVTQHEASIDAGSVDGKSVSVVSQATYNGLTPDANTIYFVT